MHIFILLASILSLSAVNCLIFPPTSGPQSSGYLTADVGSNAQMFYWLFEASNQSAPLILWLEGGPGISGMFQIFHGMGPYRITSDLTISSNPNTWNKYYNLLFVDNPCGVGFSTVNPGQEVTNEKEMARQLYNALQAFYDKHPQFRNNEFYVFGESYGGKYVPAIADYIQQQNADIGYKRAEQSFSNNFKKKARDNIYIPLKGIGIGNGLTDPINQVQTFADFFYNIGLYSLEQKAMAEQQQQTFLDQFNRGDFFGASITYWSIITNASSLGQYIFYDYTCDMDCIMKNYLWGAYATLLNKTEAKRELHVPQNVSYESMSPAVAIALFADFSQSMAYVFPSILEDYKVLIFQGSLDTVVTSVGADTWLSKIDWPLMPKFQQTRRTSFSMNNEVVGLVRTYDNLTQFVLPKSGHFVTIQQPEVALEMVHRFIENVPFK